MAGTKQTTKQGLIDSVVAKVFKNNTFAVTATNLQTAMLDIVESLWDDRSVKTFSGSSTYISVTGKRYLSGNDVTFLFTVDFTDTGTNEDSVTINDILPLDFEGFKWFKPLQMTMVVDSVTTVGNGSGFIELNDLNTYFAGTPTASDITRLHVAGTAQGTQRSFTFDLDDAQYGSYDVEETTEGSSNNYLGLSPKDLSVSALNLKVRNMADVTPATTTIEGSMTFQLKGSLL